MRNRALADDWLRRARSNLERARGGKVSEGVLYEDLCFDCQQAVEKSLKALLVGLDVVFPWSHSISRLIELLEQGGTEVPDGLKGSTALTDYAVTARYPGSHEPVDREEYEEALGLAETAFAWVITVIEDVGP
jgi:HEPN domain-containing protein